jgi:hypothetical protein
MNYPCKLFFRRKLFLACWCLAIGAVFVCAVPDPPLPPGSLIPDAPFSNGGVLTPAPDRARVGGFTSSEFRRVFAYLNGPVGTLRQVDRCPVRRVSHVPLPDTFEFVCTFPIPVIAGSSDRYNVTLKGMDEYGWVLAAKTMTDMTFGETMMFYGQSGFTFPFGPTFFFAPVDPTLTNRTAELEQWSSDGTFERMTFWVNADSSNASPETFRNTMSVVNGGWQRYRLADGTLNPLFMATLNAMGSQSVYNCALHVQTHGGPLHCAQIAESSTGMRAHLPRDIWKKMGVTNRNPQTSANTDRLNKPGAIFQGVMYGFRNWNPHFVRLSQGEKNFFDCQNLGAYQLALHDLLCDGGFFKNRKRTHCAWIALGNYGGIPAGSPPNIAQNPAFAACVQSQYAVRDQKKGCFIPASDTDYFTLRPNDFGLHTPDTYPILAQRTTDCVFRQEYGGTSVSEGPIIDYCLRTSYDAGSGWVSVNCTFTTQNYPGTSVPIAVVYALAPKAVNSTGPVFAYEQMTGVNVLPSGPTLVDTATLTVTQYGTPTLTFTFRVNASLGLPTAFSYNPTPNPQVVIANDPLSTAQMVGYNGRFGWPARYFDQPIGEP